MQRKHIFENFFDDIDDIQVNDTETKVSSKLDFDDPKWPVFIGLFFYFDDEDDTSKWNINKISKFMKSKLDTARIIEDYSDIYITDNEHVNGNKNLFNCLVSEFNNNWSEFSECNGFHLCVGVVPNKSSNIVQAWKLLIELLQQTDMFLKNILNCKLTVDSITVMDHNDNRNYIGSWVADMNSRKDRFYAHFDTAKIMVPDVDEKIAFEQLRNYFVKKNLYKSAIDLFIEDMRDKNRGYRFYDALLKNSKHIPVSNSQWKKFTKYMKYGVLFDNLSGSVVKNFSLNSGFAGRVVEFYNFLDKLRHNNELTITYKIIFFLRGKDKKHVWFMFFIDGVFQKEPGESYQSAVLRTSTYVEIPYMLAAALYSLHILNADPYEALEQINGICSMPQKDYDKTKTILGQYIDGTEEVPTV